MVSLEPVARGVAWILMRHPPSWKFIGSFPSRLQFIFFSAACLASFPAPLSHFLHLPVFLLYLPSLFRDETRLTWLTTLRVTLFMAPLQSPLWKLLGGLPSPCTTLFAGNSHIILKGNVWDTPLETVKSMEVGNLSIHSFSVWLDYSSWVVELAWFCKEEVSCCISGLLLSKCVDFPF